MIDWINKQIKILTSKNKNVIIYPDTLEKRNRRLEDTTTDPIYEEITKDGQKRRCPVR